MGWWSSTQMKSGGGKEGRKKRGKQSGRREEERRGREGQKGKLVHAMIMVMNHKSHNIAGKTKNQHSQTKEKINNNPSHKKSTKCCRFPRCVQSIQITMVATQSATGYGLGDDKTAPVPTEMEPWGRRRPGSIQALTTCQMASLHPVGGPFRLSTYEGTDNSHS